MSVQNWVVLRGIDAEGRGLLNRLALLNPSEAMPSPDRYALDTIAEALLMLDSRGNTERANSAFAELTEMPPQSLLAADNDIGGVLISMDDAAQLEEQKVLLRESMKVAEQPSHAKIAFLKRLHQPVPVFQEDLVAPASACQSVASGQRP